MSANQLKNAPQKANLNYKVEQVENTNFPDNEFDLITVAQAIHWFDFEPFYLQVKRTLKPNGIFAVIGYGLFSINYEIDLIIQSLYTDILGEYWDDERKYLDENYETIPFPFNEIKTPQFTSNFNWTYHQLIGYLETWSAVQHYIKKNEKNPLDIISKELKTAWGKQVAMPVNFKIILRIGTV
jgi:ubiquinone/menaquinone biosynthesis C-methylase UbiE